MRLGQIRWNNTVMASVFDAEGARPIPDYKLYDLLIRAEAERVPLQDLAIEHAASQHVETPPVIPLYPREVWGCGGTFKEAISERPQIFFKGAARVCVGLNKNIGIRPDSNFTVPELELAVVLGKNGQVLGYTVANDVTAVDISRDYPDYLAQSKVFTGSCALGPVIVTPDTIPDPYDLAMSCTITRGEKVIFSETSSTSGLRRKITELVEHLLRFNPVPSGSVLMTGSPIHVPEEARLVPGDVVSLQISEIGELRNTAALI